jgi:ribose transport system substrate-binding protein
VKKGLRFMIVLVLLTMLVPSLFAKGQEEKSGDGPMKFAVLYSVAHPFFNPCDEGAKDKAAELGVEVIIDAPSKPDIGMQVDMIENFIVQGVDGIAVCPVGAEGLLPVIQKAVDSGIPVILFGIEIPLENASFAYAGTNQEYYATHAAEVLSELMGGKGELIISSGVPTAPDMIVRVGVFTDIIEKDYPDMNIVDVQYSQSDCAKALTNVENMMQAHPDVTGFYGTDACAGGAISAVLRDRKQKIAAVTGDDFPEIIQGVKDGLIDLTIVQQPYQWTYTAVQALYDHINGKTVPKFIDAETLDITKANVDEYYDENNIKK